MAANAFFENVSRQRMEGLDLRAQLEEENIILDFSTAVDTGHAERLPEAPPLPPELHGAGSTFVQPLIDWPSAPGSRVSRTLPTW
ncbi:MAG TPA: hypothetical protein VGH81_13810 [Rudaea sp.]|jgi:hypothetical protein